MKPNRAILAVVALLCLVLSLAIATELFRHSSNAVASAATTDSAESSPASDGQPRRGGTLHLVEPTDFRSLDPAIAYDTESVPIVRLLFRGLLDYDNGVNLVPAQAKDWNISPDGKTYTFHLRPGIRFADGREVEAQDYVFSFERILDPATESPGQGFFMGIQGAAEFVAGKAKHVSGLSAPDPRTLIIKLKDPQFTFRYVLAMTFAVAEPRDVVQHYGKDFEIHLDGSGPYRLTGWKRGIRVRLARNPFYTGPDGYVDAVDVMIGGDSSTEAMMLERGELDRVMAGPPEAIHFERDPRLRSLLVPVPTANTDYLFMNTEMKPFDQMLVRRAVNYAINKARLLRLTGGFATIANGIVPPAMSWTNPGLPPYDYDPDKARALLRQAGFPNGFKTTFSYMEDNPIFVRVAQDIQQDLQQVGIDASLRPANFTAFDLESSSRHQVPLGIWGWFQDYPDPSDFLDVLFNGRYITPTDCNNVAFYDNPAVNRLLDQATASVDPAERTRLFLRAEDLIMDDAPWVPLIHEVLPVLYNPRVHNTAPHPVWLWRYEWMWLNPS
ncbi:MAG TPA: ABC transporter substrate-binding protein [Verrucomicrobiae bacterium]|nr:ABC transporter substrate-binding protein [Verrucomicrobiae bacterium]